MPLTLLASSSNPVESNETVATSPLLSLLHATGAEHQCDQVRRSRASGQGLRDVTDDAPLPPPSRGRYRCTHRATTSFSGRRRRHVGSPDPLSARSPAASWPCGRLPAMPSQAARTRSATLRLGVVQRRESSVKSAAFPQRPLERNAIRSGLVRWLAAGHAAYRKLGPTKGKKRQCLTPRQASAATLGTPAPHAQRDPGPSGPRRVAGRA